MRIVDVARLAEVSPATVSRVLNGSARVSAALRRRVESAASSLGYRPNPHARALHSGRSRAVGIAATYVGGFFAELFGGLEGRLAASGYRLLVAGGSGERDAETDTLIDLHDRGVDGLVVFLEAAADEDLLALAARGVPMVVLGRSVPGLEPRSLSWDQRAGGATATRHLLEHGHRRIAHIAGPRDNLHAQARREGYADALRSHGIPVEPRWIVEGDFLEQSGRDAMHALLDIGGFTAVFAANDQMALGALTALWERGLSCPEHISLVGFDDQALARFTAPPLTTVRQPLDALGRLAADLLLSDIHRERPAGRTDLPPLRLISRASVRERGAA
ncbi:MAG: LacI family DNA-binding transcriptional regulator [Deinococcales bacterium]